MSDLCSIEDVREWLGIAEDDTSQDEKLQRLITAASKQFMDETRRPDFAPHTDYTDRLNGTGTCDLFLKHYPINEVATVSINGVEQSESSDGIESGWFFDDTQLPEERQKIVLIGCFWPKPCTWYGYTAPNIVVEYNAGYDENEIPEDVTQAVIELVGWKRGYGQLQSQDQTTNTWQQIGQYQSAQTAGKTTLEASALNIPESVQQIIDRYMRSPL